MLLDISQRYKLKANHNLSWLKCFVVIVVGYKPKIQIESKSQQEVDEVLKKVRCWI